MISLHLVSYDIRCPKRWRRVFGLLKRHGVHRQLSVFLVKLDPKRLARLRSDLHELLDTTQDSLLIVRIDGGESGISEFGLYKPLPGARLVIL